MTRTRNARGEGSRLREELLRGAQCILERTASEDAVTLRAIAREAGVAPNSIYSHFADGQAVLDALVQRTFEQLSAALVAARETADAPAERLLAICLAYIGLGIEHPELYLTLFERRRSLERARRSADAGRSFEGTRGAEAFAILVDAVAAVAPPSSTASAEASAALLWAGLHGYVTLTAGQPAFPWFPSPEDASRRLIAHLATAAPRPAAAPDA